MKIQLNGQTVDTSAETLAQLLAERQTDSGSVACALNGEFIPRAQYACQRLTAGCHLEVLSPMQGG